MVVVTLVSILIAALSQIGMTQAQFEFVENDLAIDSRGLANGRILWSFQDRHIRRSEPWQFVCSIKNLQLDPAALAKLNSLKPGDRRTLRYRDVEIGGLKKQDPFAKYIRSELGISADHVIGYAWFDGWTEVVISGR